MRIAVIGGGVLGLAAAASLTARDQDVTVFDHRQTGATLGSSAGSTRLWRIGDASPDTVELGMHALEAWERLEHNAGQPLRSHEGIVIAGAESAAWQENLAPYGIELEEVPAEVSRMFRADPGQPVSFSRHGGTIHAQATLEALQAALSGGEGRRHAGFVRSIRHQAGSAVVSAVDGEHRFDAVVVAAGAGSARLLNTAGINVHLTSVLEQVAHFTPIGSDVPPPYFERGEPPTDRTTALLGSTSIGTYAMPDPRGYKVGIDIALRVLGEDDDDRTASPTRTAEIETFVRHRIPALIPVARATQVCSYALSQDAQFIIDQRGPIFTLCADSGKAFKFAPELGNILAALVLNNPHPFADRYRLNRRTLTDTG